MRLIFNQSLSVAKDKGIKMTPKSKILQFLSFHKPEFKERSGIEKIAEVTTSFSRIVE
jgi:hypothetical protein